MSSSQVEVKESGHGANLPFEISPESINGIDIQPHIDGEPPKDHTYNKDPEIIETVQEEIIESFCEEIVTEEEKQMEDEVPQKSSRSSRNIKHKFIKKHTVEKTKLTVKKEASKKTPRRKVSNVDIIKSDLLPVEESDGVANDVASINKSEDVENISPEESPKKKKSRKRKIDENNEEKSAKLSSDAESGVLTEELVIAEDDEIKEEGAKYLKPQKKKAKVLKKKYLPNKSSKTKSSAKQTSPKQTVTKDRGGSSSDEDLPLPPGWTRKIVERKSGKSAGQFDIYIYSPEGIKFRSRPDIAAYLARTKSNLKIEDFSFSKRRYNPTTTGSVSAASRKQVNEKTRQKKKTSSGSSGKKGKILVKLTTPKKKVLSVHQKKEKKVPSDKGIDIKPSTSGISQKRVGGNRRKK